MVQSPRQSRHPRSFEPANSALVITLLKEQIHVLAQAQPLTAEVFERIQGVRRKIYDSDDYQEGIRAFFEKRKPVFQGK